MEKILKAKYQANKNLFVTCYLNVVEATSKEFKAQIGIRSPGDTIVPVGTKLYLIQENFSPTENGDPDLFFVVVEGIEIDGGLPVQVCSPICKENRQDSRKKERQDCYFEVSSIDGMAFEQCTAINGSMKGLGLKLKAAKIYSGLVLDNTCQLSIPVAEENETISLPVKIAHIQYNWQTYEHLIGVQILQATTQDSELLYRLLNPIPEGRRATTIDEEAKIHLD
jgi:PilZ domain